MTTQSPLDRYLKTAFEANMLGLAVMIVIPFMGICSIIIGLLITANVYFGSHP